MTDKLPQPNAGAGNLPQRAAEHSVPQPAAVAGDEARLCNVSATSDVASNVPAATAPPQVRGVWRILYAAAAALFFVLGVLGLMLPGLPTTPFLLLTSYFLVRISPALNQRLLRSRFVGPILTDWQVNRGVRPDIKVKAISVVILAVTLTLFLSGAQPVIAGVTLLFASIGVFVIVKLPTIGDGR